MPRRHPSRPAFVVLSIRAYAIGGATDGKENDPRIRSQIRTSRETERARGRPVNGRLTGVAVAAVAGGAVLLVGQSRYRSVSTAGDPAEPRSRWIAVTVNRTAEDISAGGRMSELQTALGRDVEIDVRTAPGDKGTELRARLRGGGASGDASRRASDTDRDRTRQLRRALREAKQIIEVGEVLRVDPTPHGPRKNTPMGAVVEYATDRGPEEGLL